jgi:DNA-binding transcriptional ArsR family regulator
VDPVEAKVFSHPLRVRILGALGVRSASAVQLAHKLGLAFDRVVYHLAVLRDNEYIEPVDGQDPDAPDPLYESARS